MRLRESSRMRENASQKPEDLQIGERILRRLRMATEAPPELCTQKSHRTIKRRQLNKMRDFSKSNIDWSLGS